MMKIRARLMKSSQDLQQDSSSIGNGRGPLSQSITKPHRRNRSSLISDATGSIPDLPGHHPGSVSSLILPSQHQPERPESIFEEPEEQEYEIVRIPIGMYGYREERRPVKKKSKKRPTGNASAGGKARFTIFGGEKKVEKRNSIPAAEAGQPGKTDAEARVREQLASLALQKTVSEPSQEELAIPEDHAAREDMRSKPVSNKGKQPEIADTDSAEFHEEYMRDYVKISSRLELQAHFDQFLNETLKDEPVEHQGQPESSRKFIREIIPADSEKHMDNEDDDDTWHTARSSASAHPLDDIRQRLDPKGDLMEEILAIEAALKVQVAHRQQELKARVKAIALQKEREEQRRDQWLQAISRQTEQEEREWNEVFEAIALRKEQELEFERQEKLDHQHALHLQQEEESRLAAAEAERNRPRECICCGDSHPPQNFPSKPATASCSHDSQTCTECMHTWFASQLDAKGATEDFTCPQCPSVLTHSDLQLYTSPETFSTYEKLLTRNALSQLPEFAWCLDPNCSSGQLNFNNNNNNNLAAAATAAPAPAPYMNCVACGYQQCVHHKCAWHHNETCAQYDLRMKARRDDDEENKKNERKTEEMLDSVSKKCPGAGCGWRIQKVDGCDHMRWYVLRSFGRYLPTYLFVRRRRRRRTNYLPTLPYLTHANDKFHNSKQCKHEFCWECLANHQVSPVHNPPFLPPIYFFSLFLIIFSSD